VAIVRVIIPFIAAGILVGPELIKAATMRSVLSQEEKAQTAIATFKGKYDCYPGIARTPAVSVLRLLSYQNALTTSLP
jgi:hypothetical protein